jgi:thiol-disulfide isomerase/thioredoxin
MSVAELQQGDLQQFGQNDRVVLFYAPWCGHCQRFMPEYKKLAQSAPHITFTQFNASDRSDELQSHAPAFVQGNVQGYPTLIFDTRGRGTYAYEGPRDLTSLTTAYKQAYGHASEVPTTRKALSVNARERLCEKRGKEEDCHGGEDFFDLYEKDTFQCRREAESCIPYIKKAFVKQSEVSTEEETDSDDEFADAETHGMFTEAIKEKLFSPTKRRQAPKTKPKRRRKRSSKSRR